MTALQDASRTARLAEFDIHGLAGIRLVDASARDVAVVCRQIGGLDAPLSRPADITIRFVDAMPDTDGMRLIGLNDAAFTEEDFFVMAPGRAMGGRAPLARLPMADIGSPCEVVCERGAESVPFLLAMVNLAALSNGGLALHATAFRYEERGYLVMGWSKGGKTEALLSFAARGARYVGDEWIYITANGARIGGLPEPIRLWDWQVRQLPEVYRRLTRKERARLALFRAAAAVARKGAGIFTGPAAQRGAALLERQAWVRVSPRRLFGSAYGPLTSPVDRVVFIGSHDRPDTTSEPVDPREVAGRMAASLNEERMPLLACYQRFLFAFPSARNRAIETASERERERLASALAGVAAISVLHPYPVEITRLCGDILAGFPADGVSPVRVSGAARASTERRSAGTTAAQ